jgi:penicillin amidase
LLLQGVLLLTWIRRTAWTALALLLLLATAAVVYVRLALPRTEGAISLAGPGGVIRIERDEHGIPTIKAESGRDLAFGLGFVHAQDRLWQLETHRRIGAGRLAEAFGAGRAGDRPLSARSGCAALPKPQWAKVQPETRAWLVAYSQGVNAVLKDQALRARPPEFLILG